MHPEGGKLVEGKSFVPLPTTLTATMAASAATKDPRNTSEKPTVVGSDLAARDEAGGGCSP
jgi:hypothetical protein